MKEIFENSSNESLRLLNLVRHSVSPEAFSVFFTIYLKKRGLHGTRLNNNDIIPISKQGLIQNTNLDSKRAYNGTFELIDSRIVSLAGPPRVKRFFRINWDRIRELGQSQSQSQSKYNNCLQRMDAYDPNHPEQAIQVNVYQRKDNECNDGKTDVAVQPDGKVTVNTYLGNTQSKIVNRLGVHKINLLCI